MEGCEHEIDRQTNKQTKQGRPKLNLVFLAKYSPVG
jgi:hypothetical protein